MLNDIAAALKALARAIWTEYEPLVGGSAWPEEQLKQHVARFAREAGETLGIGEVRTKFESPVEGVGRPDIAVYVDGLLVGHVELKKPGTGANAPRYRGRNRQQWKKFSDLPNVIYTDGAEFGLFRHGDRARRLAKLGGDPRDEGAEAVTEEAVRDATDLFRTFFDWQPQVPRRPKALAEALAPVCHLLREDVKEALNQPASPLVALAEDWRQFFIADASDREFADAYAQTLTYALLLARFSGADDLSIPNAAASLRGGHRLLGEALRILGNPEAREAIGSTVDLLERIIEGVDPAIFERQGVLLEDGPAHAADPWLYFYEDFLAAYDAKLRNNRGVYYTPWQVVQAQVRLTAHLLDTGFDAPDGFADEKVVTLDPACGTGTYILTAVRHGIDSAVARRGASPPAPRASPEPLLRTQTGTPMCGNMTASDASFASAKAKTLAS